MNSSRIASAVFSLILVFTPPLQAQVEKNLEEVNFTGGFYFSRSDGSTYHTIQFDILYGYFVTEGLEVEVNFGINKMESRDTFGTMSGGVSYHFSSSPDDTGVPFVGGRVGFGYGLDENPGILSVFVGYKQFVAKGGGAFSIRAFYSRQGSSYYTSNRYGVLNGVSIFF